MDKYIKKFGEDEIMLMVNEDLIRLSQSLWSYRNHCNNDPELIKRSDRTPCQLDQQIGKVIYNLRLLENILLSRHKYTSVDIMEAVKRWEDHTKFHEAQNEPEA